MDAVKMARPGDLDMAIIFSQAQDLSEVADQVREVSRSEVRWLKVISAFPDDPSVSPIRGIDRTDWFRMDRAFYDDCLDLWDYRPRRR